SAEKLAAPRVLSAFGDPLSPGAALSLARQLVRSAAGLRDGDPGETQREALRAHLTNLSLDARDDSFLDALADVSGATTAHADGTTIDPDRLRERSGIALSRWL